MTYQAEGVLHKVFDEEQKSDRFKAREFVIETEDQYPQFVKFQLVNDKCDLANGHNEGERVKVSFDLRGREWNGKYFTNLQAWKIESASGESSGGSAGSGAASGAASGASSGQSTGDSSGSTAASKTTSAPSAASLDFDDDIPF